MVLGEVGCVLCGRVQVVCLSCFFISVQLLLTKFHLSLSVELGYSVC